MSFVRCVALLGMCLVALGSVESGSESDKATNAFASVATATRREERREERRAKRRDERTNANVVSAAPDTAGKACAILLFGLPPRLNGDRDVGSVWEQGFELLRTRFFPSLLRNVVRPMRDAGRLVDVYGHSWTVNEQDALVHSKRLARTLRRSARRALGDVGGEDALRNVRFEVDVSPKKYLHISRSEVFDAFCARPAPSRSLSLPRPLVGRTSTRPPPPTTCCAATSS